MYALTGKLILLFVSFILCKSQDDDAIRMDGQYILGGLFPVHRFIPEDLTCGPISPRGIPILEAMLYAIDRVNEFDFFFEPPLKLGVEIFDTCGTESITLEKTVSFISAADCPLDEDSKEFKKVIGVIGPALTTNAIAAANLLTIFKIPQISFAAASTLLSDKTKFNYFARTMPREDLMARGMANIVQAFNWSYISTVATLGINGIDIFEKEANSRHICVALSIQIPLQANDENFDDVIAQLRRKSLARIVVLYLNPAHLIPFWSAYKRANIEKGHFLWVASDTWSRNLEKNHQAEAEGAIVMELQTFPNEWFEEYFFNLRPENNDRNPWFSEYWEDQFKCSLSVPNNTHTPECSGSEKLTVTNYQHLSWVNNAISAVFAMANGIRDALAGYCSNNDCRVLPEIAGDMLYKSILNVSLYDEGSWVEFDSNGDVKGIYNILNFHKSDEQYEFKQIGTWENQKLVLDTSEAVFGQKFTDLDPAGIPYSRCGEICQPGEFKMIRNDEPCCWECTKCLSYQYLRDESTCADCPEGRWPNDNFSGCDKLSYQSFQWTEPSNLIAIIIACIGITGTLATLGIFIIYKDTPVVKTSCREMIFTLLVGILMCYLMTFVLLAPPSILICTIQRFGLGFSFSICYASILTKMNRISRIFKKLQYSNRPAKFINPQSQIFICFCLFGFQIVIEILWLVLNPPSIREVFPSRTDPIAIAKCGVGEISFIALLAFYNLILVILCTVYAFKMRNIPEKFNDTQNIALSNYSVLIVWMAFFIIYFSVGENSEVTFSTMLIVVGLLYASVIFVCIFFPKLHIIIFQPEKNVLTPLDYTAIIHNRRKKSKKSSMPTSTVGSIHETESATRKDTFTPLDKITKD